MVILYTLHDNSYIDIKDVKDLTGKTVYVNMTNRCPCACMFCLRQTKQMEESNSLWLKEEPSVKQIIDELKQFDLSKCKECVFCGFGEPMERLDDLLEVASYLKKVAPNLPIRINTNGLANMIYQRDITPLLKGYIDTISISLNASNKEEFYRLTRSKFGLASFDGMLDFTQRCKKYVPHVILSVLDIIGEDEIKKCKAICNQLQVTLRVRPFEK